MDQPHVDSVSKLESGELSDNASPSSHQTVTEEVTLEYDEPTEEYVIDENGISEGHTSRSIEQVSSEDMQEVDTCNDSVYDIETNDETTQEIENNNDMADGNYARKASEARKASSSRKKSINIEEPKPVTSFAAFKQVAFATFDDATNHHESPFEKLNDDTLRLLLVHNKIEVRNNMLT